MHTKLKGDISEAKVLAALVQRHPVLLPFGENHRYDLVIETEDSFKRVQVKTGCLRNGTIRFNGFSSTAHHKNGTRRGYAGEVDYFGVYCPELDKCYLVPIEEVSVTCWLRVEPTRNNQKKLCKMASKYELA